MWLDPANYAGIQGKLPTDENQLSNSNENEENEDEDDDNVSIFFYVKVTNITGISFCSNQ